MPRPFLAALLLLLVAATVAVEIVVASPARSVSLVYFRGEITSNGALLEWQTATELNTAGFRIERSASAEGPFLNLDEIGVVAAQGGATSGATYEVTDTTATTNQIIWYRLLEIEVNNSEHELDTISLNSGATPTATLEGIATDDSGNGDDEPQPTSNATSSTPQASPSATSGAPTSTPADGGTNTTATAAVTPATLPAGTPGATVDNGTTVRQVGGGGDDGATSPTAVTRTSALAQATGGYPGPDPTESVDTEGYPGSDLGATATVTSTAGSYPAGVPASGTPSLNSGNDRTVGAGNGAGQNGENQSEQSANLGRILLWIGFAAALLIFIAGAFFSIIISTRKQRHDIS